MQREILFRSAHFNKHDKFVGFSLWGRLDYRDEISEETFKSPSYWYESPAKHEDQFTGLVVKHNIRVFGGDILKFTDEEFESFYAEVFWKEYAWMLRFADTGEEDWLFEYTDHDYYEVEKVGDIYQNPELLNNQKQ